MLFFFAWQDIGLDPNRPDTRLYATAAPQPIHNDGAPGGCMPGMHLQPPACAAALLPARPALPLPAPIPCPAPPRPAPGPADVVTLLCLAPAAEGGASTWSSSTTVYNEVLRRRPDLLEVGTNVFVFSRPET